MMHRLSFAALAAALVAQEPAREARVFNVAPLVRAYDVPLFEPTQAPLGAAIRFFASGPESTLWTAVDIDRLVSLAVEAVEGASELQLQAEGRRIWVRGPAAQQEAAAAMLAAASAAFGEEVVIRVALYAAPPPKALMTAAEAKAFLDETSPVSLASVVGPIGRPARIRSGADVAVCLDYEVEVAQKAQIADPVVSRLQLGLLARAVAHGLPDGRLLVRVGGTFAAAEGEPEARSLESKGLGDVQSWRVASSTVAGAAVIEDGGAFALGASGGAAGYWVAHAGRARPSSALADRFIPVDALLVEAAATVEHQVEGISVSDGPGGSESTSLNSEAPTSVDFLLEELQSSLWGPGVQGEGERIEVVGGRVLATGSPAFRGKVREAAQRFAARFIASAAFEARFGVVSEAEARALQSGAADPAQKLAGRAFGSCVSGESFRLMAGRERSLIVEQNVEIAQEATMADPQSGVAYSGFVFEGRADRNQDGVTIAGTFLHQQEMASKPFLPRTPELGGFDLPRLDRRILKSAVTADAGAWRTFGSAANGDGVLVVMVRAAK